MVTNAASAVADFWKRQGRLDLISYAASIAFFLCLSLIPILILLSFIIPLTGYGCEELVAVVTDITPEFLDFIVTRIIVETFNRSSGMLPVSVIVLLWTSSGSMFALVKGLQRVYGIKFRRSMLLVRLRSVIYMVMIILFFIASLLYVVFQDRLIEFFTAKLSQMPFISVIFLYWRHLVMLPLYIIFLIFVYHYMSEVRGKWRYHLPGALVTTALWYLFSYAFSLYISRVDPYSTFYGSLSVLVVLLLWLYFCCYILLVCGFLNRYIMEKRGITVVSASSGGFAAPVIMAVQEIIPVPWKSRSSRPDEPVLTLHIFIDGCDAVEGKNKSIYCIKFHGDAESEHFKGRVLPGGVDTQTKEAGRPLNLSARYILEGKDSDGEDCRIFIENNGQETAGGIRTVPKVVTDSRALSWLMDAKLYGVLETGEDPESGDAAEASGDSEGRETAEASAESDVGESSAAEDGGSADSGEASEDSDTVVIKIYKEG